MRSGSDEAHSRARQDAKRREDSQRRSDEGESPLAINIAGLAHRYSVGRRRAGTTALDGVDLEVPRGQSLALLGPNGSGKSTLNRIIAGTLPVQTGTVELCGGPIDQQARDQLGVVFQHPALDQHLTVEENLVLQATLYGLRRPARRKRITAALEAAGLSGHRRKLVKTLSAGLARRVDLCRALLHHPAVLLLDEPTVGLDPSARLVFLDQLELQRAQRDITVVFSTHLTDEADRQDRVVLLDHGRVVADDTPIALRNELGDQLVTVHDRNWQPPSADALSAARWTPSSRGWRLHVGADGSRLAGLAASLAEARVPYTIAPPTLDDVFEHHAGTRLEVEEPASLQPATEESTAPEGEQP